MKTNMFQKTLFGLAAATLTTTSFSAVANAQQRETRSAIVSFADLDLTSADGKATFQGRIKGAVRQVCGSFNSKDLKDSMDHRKCMTEAKASAKRASVTLMAAAEAGEPIETAMVVSN